MFLQNHFKDSSVFDITSKQVSNTNFVYIFNDIPVYGLEESCEEVRASLW